MPPELDLLDILLGQPESLRMALLCFGLPADSAALQRAQHAVSMQIQDGLVDVIHKSGGIERVLSQWEVSNVLTDTTNWLMQESEAAYFLSLTPKGAKYMGY